MHRIGVGRRVAALQKKRADLRVLPLKLRSRIHHLPTDTGIVKASPVLHDSGKVRLMPQVPDHQPARVLNTAALQQSRRNGRGVAVSTPIFCVRLSVVRIQGTCTKEESATGRSIASASCV